MAASTTEGAGEDVRLILVIDRDNDLGRKAEINGPVMGEEDTIKAAVKLALADPTDTDANTLFEGVRVYRELAQSKQSITRFFIAAITGDVSVGTKSDMKLSAQLDHVLAQTKAKSVILVTDGAEDEYVTPMVESRVKIDSIDRVVVKQSERLEGFYYMTAEFIKKATLDPNLSALFLGVPGLAALVFFVYGWEGSRILAGVLGTYLVLKGFHMERFVEDFFAEFFSAYREARISFITYLITIILILFSITQGLSEMERGGNDPMQAASAFVAGAVVWFSAAVIFTLLGKSIDALPDTGKLLRYFTLVVYTVTIAFMAQKATEPILNPDFGVQGVASSIAVGLVVILGTAVVQMIVRRRFILD